MEWWWKRTVLVALEVNYYDFIELVVHYSLCD